MKDFFITTPLYYVNSVPHIGHAYTTIAVDVLARWKRLTGHKVFFLTGTDEHGAKIAQAAQEAGVDPQKFVNNIAGKYKSLWQVLNISYDDFIQTTEKRHTGVVQSVFEKLKKTGDIYKGVYEDWYCIHDESYFSEAELKDKKCPLCGRDVQRLKEDSYFFKLSKYEKPLLELFEKNPQFLSPRYRANEIINFVKSGLKDLSVSRTRVSWGVPVQSDPPHVVYVWFDALLNYISSPGYIGAAASPPNSLFGQKWPADVHVVGKEIYRFHTVIWPAMLMALNLPLPKKVFAHGWWTVEGTKMSKSLGNVVDPRAVSEEYGVDPLRYFLLREVPFGSDGDYSEKSLLGRYNSELANNLGNLLNRTTTIVLKNLNGTIPPISAPLHLMENITGMIQDINKKFEDLAFGDVLELIYGLMVKTNQYIDEKAPWKLGPDQKNELSSIMIECLAVLKVLAFLLNPFMPSKTQELWERLGEKGSLGTEGEKFLTLNLKSPLKETPISFSPGQLVIKGNPLFMRKGGRWK